MTPPKIPDSYRPFVVLLTGSRISLLGVALATTAGFSWLFILPQHLRGNADNPYIGILIFLIIPAILFLGLALIPIGVTLSRRRIREGFVSLPDRHAAWRKLGLFLGLMTFVNIVIGSQATYRAVQHMETAQFCGQTCHVMKPEFTGWKQAAHSKVLCVECHVAPGASGWFASKMSGTRQLVGVLTDTFPRPTRGAIETNRLVGSEETCERCHARNREIGSVMKVIPTFKDDEKNTKSQTVLMLLVGGKSSGIHGAHMGHGVTIRYAAKDAKRDTIPWIEHRGPDGKVTTYTDGSGKGLPEYTMQCVDCHNRPAHTFETAERAVNAALASGQLPVSLPFLKKTSVELLTQSKTGEDIPLKLAQFYTGKPVAGADVTAAGKVLTDIFSRNVFPDLKVTWGTYTSNLGHTDAPGCFRCHDGSHVSADKIALTQDCTTCHRMIAVDEAAPEVLKTLGVN
jgi:nitrate/TMAO reductase-like tetraheme cytochrome c subunit